MGLGKWVDFARANPPSLNVKNNLGQTNQERLNKILRTNSKLYKKKLKYSTLNLTFHFKRCLPDIKLEVWTIIILIPKTNRVRNGVFKYVRKKLLIIKLFGNKDTWQRRRLVLKAQDIYDILKEIPINLKSI